MGMRTCYCNAIGPRCTLDVLSHPRPGQGVSWAADLPGDEDMQSTNTYGGAGPAPGAAPVTAPCSGARNINARDGHISPSEIAVGVVIGRASEYFDFFVYAIASVLVFPTAFFPFVDRLEGTLYAFTIFAFAFIARPFGTIFFMAIQRRFSREAKLMVALLLLGTSTATISALPTYDDLGTTAIVFLALLRIGQGVAQGGSWDGLPSLLALSAPENKRGWFAMLGQL